MHGHHYPVPPRVEKYGQAAERWAYCAALAVKRQSEHLAQGGPGDSGSAGSNALSCFAYTIAAATTCVSLIGLCPRGF